MINDKEQIESIKNWVVQGASISDVQSKLKEEFGVVMTYMDVRFLIDDLGVELVSTPEPVEEVSNAEENIASDASSENSNCESLEEDASGIDATIPMQPDEQGVPIQGAGVKVSVSPIQRPDCIISGDVEFSDGSKAEWRIDRMGQLGLVPADPTMNPSQSDIMEFQRQLQQLLR